MGFVGFEKSDCYPFSERIILVLYGSPEGVALS